MESEPQDFVDEETIKELTELTKTFQSSGWDVFGEEILSNLQKEIEPLLLQTLSPVIDVIPETTLPPGTNVDKLLLGLDETTFAQQLTSYDARIYQRVQKREFVNPQDWHQEAHFHRCRNLRRWIADFNTFSSWVASVIVSEQNLERRVEIYCKLVRVAFVCFRLHNLNGVMKLIAGLVLHLAVNRLRLTKEAAPNEIKGMLEELMKVFSPTKSYEEYRNLMSTIKPPAIPYLGVSLADLAMFENGNHSVDVEKIDVRKKKLICQVIREIGRFQETASYPFEEDQIVMACFGNLSKLDDEQLRQLSLQREPTLRRKP